MPNSDQDPYRNISLVDYIAQDSTGCPTWGEPGNSYDGCCTLWHTQKVSL